MKRIHQTLLDPNSHTELKKILGASCWSRLVVEVFGARALIQRCREHKKRNVSEALPERMRGSVRTTMNQAYASRDPKRARRLLDNLWHYIQPGKPMQNAFVESFNSKL